MTVFRPAARVSALALGTALLLAGCANAPNRPSSVPLEINLVALNDFHGNLEPSKFTYTPPGGTVLDPFMGSATTGVAALRAGLRFVGVEMSDGYFDVAQTRMREAATR